MATSREKLELQRRMRLKVMLETLEQNKRLELSKAREEDDLSKMVLDLGLDGEDPEPTLDELDEEFIYEDDGQVACSKCFGTKEIKACEQCNRKLCMDHMDSHACASMREGDVVHADFKNKKRLPNVEQKVQEEMVKLQQKYPMPTSLHLRNKFYTAAPKELVDEAFETLGEVKIEKLAEDVFNANDDLSGLEIPGSKGGSIEKMDLEQKVWEKMFKLQQTYDYQTAGELADELVAQAPELSDRVFDMLDDARLEALAQDVMESERGASFGDDRERWDVEEEDRRLNGPVDIDTIKEKEDLDEIVGPSDVATHDMHEETEEFDYELDSLISMLDSIVANRGDDIVDATELVDAFKSDNPEKWEELVDKHDGDEEVAFDAVLDAANIALGNPAEEEFDDSMDGDAESALASAGMGTDEDYGDFGGGEDMDEERGPRVGSGNIGPGYKRDDETGGLWIHDVNDDDEEEDTWFPDEDLEDLDDEDDLDEGSSAKKKSGELYKDLSFKDLDDLDDVNRKQDWEDKAEECSCDYNQCPCMGMCDEDECSCCPECNDDEELEEETSRQATWKRSRDRKKGLDEEHGDNPWPSPTSGEECPDCGDKAGFREEDCSCSCHDRTAWDDEEDLDEAWSDMDLSGGKQKEVCKVCGREKVWSDKYKMWECPKKCDVKQRGTTRVDEASRLEFSKKKEKVRAGR